jgi:hypothetical protein
MSDDQFYEAVLSRASVHLQFAWDAFCEDPALAWRQRPGNVPRARVRAWIDALKRELEHREQIERALG